MHHMKASKPARVSPVLCAWMTCDRLSNQHSPWFEAEGAGKHWMRFRWFLRRNGCGNATAPFVRSRWLSCSFAVKYSSMFRGMRVLSILSAPFLLQRVSHSNGGRLCT